MEKKTDALKILGLLSMIIDHIGFGFFPQYPVLRIIGRIAFPIFAYELAEGVFRTKNIKRYAMRLLIAASLAQIPFMLYFNEREGDTLYTLLLALIIIHAMEHRKIIVMVIGIILAAVVPLDYGCVGVMIPIVFYLGRNNPRYTAILQLFTVGILAMAWRLDLAAYLGVLLVLWFQKHPISIKVNQYFYYFFYPIHLAVLVIFKAVI
jgi:hypothetical protein